MRTGDVTHGMMSVQTITRNERQMSGFQSSTLLFPTGGGHKVSKTYPRPEAAACNRSYTSTNQNLKQTHMSIEGYTDSRPISQGQKFRLFLLPSLRGAQRRGVTPPAVFLDPRWLHCVVHAPNSGKFQLLCRCIGTRFWAHILLPLSIGCQETQPQ